MPNLKDQIIEAAKSKRVPIEVAGIKCFAQKWGEGEQIEWAIACQTGVKSEGMDADLWIRCKAIQKSLCNEDGSLIFQDYKELSSFDPEIIDAVWDEVIKLQSRADADAKKN